MNKWQKVIGKSAAFFLILFGSGIDDAHAYGAAIRLDDGSFSIVANYESEQIAQDSVIAACTDTANIENPENVQRCRPSAIVDTFSDEVFLYAPFADSFGRGADTEAAVYDAIDDCVVNSFLFSFLPDPYQACQEAVLGLESREITVIVDADEGTTRIHRVENILANNNPAFAPIFCGDGSVADDISSSVETLDVTQIVGDTNNDGTISLDPADGEITTIQRQLTVLILGTITVEVAGPLSYTPNCDRVDPACATGTTLQVSNNTCVADSTAMCPDGQRRDPVNNECVLQCDAHLVLQPNPDNPGNSGNENMACFPRTADLCGYWETFEANPAGVGGFCVPTTQADCEADGLILKYRFGDSSREGRECLPPIREECVFGTRFVPDDPAVAENDAAAVGRCVPIQGAQDCEEYERFDNGGCIPRSMENCMDDEVFSPRLNDDGTPANNGGVCIFAGDFLLTTSVTPDSHEYTSDFCDEDWQSRFILSNDGQNAAEVCEIPLDLGDSLQITVTVTDTMETLTLNLGGNFQFRPDENGNARVDGCLIRESAHFSGIVPCNNPRLFGEIGGFPQMPPSFVPGDRLTVAVSLMTTNIGTTNDVISAIQITHNNQEIGRVEMLTCDENEEAINGMCVCVNGFEREGGDGRNACVEIMCEANEVVDEQNMCVCQNGFDRENPDGTGACVRTGTGCGTNEVPSGSACICIPDHSRDSTGACVRDSGGDTGNRPTLPTPPTTSTGPVVVDFQRDTAKDSQVIAGAVVGGFAVFYGMSYFLGGDILYTPDFGYSVTENGYSINGGGRASFRKDGWHFYYSAKQTNRDGEFGDLRYASGGKYTGDIFTAAFSESVSGKTVNYNVSLSADISGGVWNISPVYRMRSRFHEGETTTRNSLNLQSEFRYNGWRIRSSAGFRWRQTNEFADSGKFRIDAIHRF